MKRVLALDISRSRTGWAVDSGTVCPPITGSRTFGEAGFPFGFISVQFKNWLVDLLKLERPNILAVEMPIIGGAPTTRHEAKILIGLPAIAELLAHISGAQYVEHAASTARAYFCGTARLGKDPKAHVLKRCHALGWPVKNTDQADAACLWAYVKSRDPKFRLETGDLMHLVNVARGVA